MEDSKSTEQNDSIDDPQAAEAPANMAPVLNMLNSWGAETPFAQISESAVGGSVLAVSCVSGLWDFISIFSCVQSVFAAQMGILEVGLKGKKRAVSKIDQQSIDQMKEIIAAQNKKRT
jgi:hypothetical protein